MFRVYQYESDHNEIKVGGERVYMKAGWWVVQRRIGPGEFHWRNHDGPFGTREEAEQRMAKLLAQEPKTKD